MCIRDLGTFCDVLICVILCWTLLDSRCLVCEQGPSVLFKTYDENINVEIKDQYHPLQFELRRLKNPE